MDQCKDCLFAKNKDDLICCQCAILKYNWRELWRTVIPVFRIDPYECPHKIALPVLCGSCKKWFPVSGYARENEKPLFHTGVCTKHKIITYKHQRCKDAERNYINEEPKGNEQKA